jgi:hypothetical protein
LFEDGKRSGALEAVIAFEAAYCDCLITAGEFALDTGEVLAEEATNIHGERQCS